MYAVGILVKLTCFDLEVTINKVLVIKNWAWPLLRMCSFWYSSGWQLSPQQWTSSVLAKLLALSSCCTYELLLKSHGPGSPLQTVKTHTLLPIMCQTVHSANGFLFTPPLMTRVQSLFSWLGTWCLKRGLKNAPMPYKNNLFCFWFFLSAFKSYLSKKYAYGSDLGSFF